MVDRIFSGLMLLVSLILLVIAWGYTAPISYDPIGPRPYPVMLLVLLAILTAIIAFRPAKFSEKIQLGLNIPIIKNLVLCTIAMILYAVLFEMLGYIIATALMAWVVGVLFGGHWLKALIASTIMAVATYFLFNGPLEVSLPAGVLGSILG
ncbi:tripartite tricarboxylate transporter TctB family protein [Moraxella haemolytica]|uniref:tripartite tricarboxylate transporter TctB family protein n=1 Tax=Moraxella TaxID=475 RepID=UPI002543C878|nr:tripartite tricarboxylate transporter TctB family protein [Moraxella sp. ZY171148]WII95400.1 tripartite tricarboxylate transporter TctB family protein [Moraxella sp. ZY171148]